MVKLFNLSHQFNHSWSSVTSANWRKYPNEFSPQVVHVDILSRSVDPSTGELRTERLIACKQPMPGWMQKLLNAESVAYFYETSTVNPKTKTHTSSTRNISYSHLMTLQENLKYTPDVKDAKKTMLEQEVQIDAAAGYATLRNAMEDACLNNFKANAEKGRLGLECVINKLRTENMIPASL